MYIENSVAGLTFDDVLLIPQYSEIKSRADVDLSRKGLLGDMRIPIISSNMDTVTEVDMAIAVTKAGGRGIFHRFYKDGRLYREVEKFKSSLPASNLILSVGVGGAAKCVFQHYHEDYRPHAVCIDVAHGHCQQVLEMIEFIRSVSPKTIIIAGNVATTEATRDLLNAGADIIKVGIGPGSLCSTRIVTGHGIPQLTAIQKCAEAADEYVSETNRPVEIIADGGVRNSGDIAKAIAAGADYVMLGSLLAATDEAPGESVKIDGKAFKQYRGMASKEVQEQLGKNVAAEGVSQMKPCKGPVGEILHELEWGLRSALTYSGAADIPTFRSKAKFTRVSGHSYVEGTPHGLHALHT